MMLRIIGAVLVVASSTGVGFMLAANCKAQERTLKQLIQALRHMACRLAYCMPPLPELCRSSAAVAGGTVGAVLERFSSELETNRYSDPAVCMGFVLADAKLPQISKYVLQMLGGALGNFDLEGQLKAINAVHLECQAQLASISQNKDVRIRNYQTLGICAGAALAILLI